MAPINQLPDFEDLTEQIRLVMADQDISLREKAEYFHHMVVEQSQTIFDIERHLLQLERENQTLETDLEDLNVTNTEMAQNAELQKAELQKTKAALREMQKLCERSEEYARGAEEENIELSEKNEELYHIIKSSRREWRSLKSELVSREKAMADMQNNLREKDALTEQYERILASYRRQRIRWEKEIERLAQYLEDESESSESKGKQPYQSIDSDSDSEGADSDSSRAEQDSLYQEEKDPSGHNPQNISEIDPSSYTTLDEEMRDISENYMQLFVSSETNSNSNKSTDSSNEVSDVETDITSNMFTNPSHHSDRGYLSDKIPQNGHITTIPYDMDLDKSEDYQVRPPDWEYESEMEGPPRKRQRNSPIEGENPLLAGDNEHSYQLLKRAKEFQYGEKSDQDAGQEDILFTVKNSQKPVISCGIQTVHEDTDEPTIIGSEETPEESSNKKIAKAFLIRARRIRLYTGPVYLSRSYPRSSTRFNPTWLLQKTRPRKLSEAQYMLRYRANIWPPPVPEQESMQRWLVNPPSADLDDDITQIDGHNNHNDNFSRPKDEKNTIMLSEQSIHLRESMSRKLNAINWSELWLWILISIVLLLPMLLPSKKDHQTWMKSNEVPRDVMVKLRESAQSQYTQMVNYEIAKLMDIDKALVG